MRQPLVAGNWKMNGSLAGNADLLAGIQAGMSEVKVAEVAVCVPAVYLAQAQVALEGSAVAWGSQDISAQDSGAYTGEISGPMLNDFGCKYAIIGHSERRTYHGETDELVADKFKAARRHGLAPILCIGETLEERESGVTNDVIARQLDAVIDACGVDMLGEGVIAYEPVWAIGTGRIPTIEQITEVHDFMRARLADRFGAEVGNAISLLYGGSVKPSNAAEIFAVANVDGALVGGASLKAADFGAIIDALQAA